MSRAAWFSAFEFLAILCVFFVAKVPAWSWNALWLIWLLAIVSICANERGRLARRY